MGYGSTLNREKNYKLYKAKMNLYIFFFILWILNIDDCDLVIKKLLMNVLMHVKSIARTSDAAWFIVLVIGINKLSYNNQHIVQYFYTHAHSTPNLHRFSVSSFRQSCHESVVRWLEIDLLLRMYYFLKRNHVSLRVP